MGSTDCTSQLRLVNNPTQVTRVDIHSPTRSVKATSLINPNQDGMVLPTAEEYTIDVVLSITMSIDSITLHQRTNVDSFRVQLHNTHGYYLEVKSNIGHKTISGFAQTQASLIRIILLGTADSLSPNHLSIKIVSSSR